MGEITQTVTDPGTAPQRTDPANFDSRADSFLSAIESWGTDLSTYASQANSLRSDVNGYKSDAETAETNAETAQTAAESAQAAATATANATTYAGGTTYAAGDVVLDPGDSYKAYISQQSSNTGNTPNTDDGTWWEIISGFEDAPADGEHYVRKDEGWVQIPKMQQPTNASPADSASGIGETPTLSGDSFTVMFGSDTHASSDWEVYSDVGLNTLVWSSYDDASNLESIDVPAGNLSVSTTYYWIHRKTGTTYGDSAWSTATSFDTAAEFSVYPAGFDDHSSVDGLDEDDLDYDSDTDTGFYGEVATANLVTGANLDGDAGLSSGTAYNSTAPWLKFYVGPNADCNRNNGVAYVLFVASKPYRYNLSWNNIYDAGCVYGVDGNGPYNSGSNTNQLTTVTYGGYNFKVRLLTGADDEPFVDDDNDMGDNSEWNDLMYRVHETDVVEGTSYADDAGVQVGDNWGDGYTDGDLVIASGDGRYCWCQETKSGDTSRRVRRGGAGVAGFATATSSVTHTAGGWRPCLELVQP